MVTGDMASCHVGCGVFWFPIEILGIPADTEVSRMYKSHSIILY